MLATTLVPLSEYLSTDYQPDREYLDGVVTERNLGERDHSKTQRNLIVWIDGFLTTEQLNVYPEQRVQVTPSRFRIPDVCVVIGPEPDEQILTQPPFLCVEILSRDDSGGRMRQKVDEYLAFGVKYVWVLDPQNQCASAFSATALGEIQLDKDGVLTTAEPHIAVPLRKIFR
ncbi:MAG: Uma2 family endonuclease [Acidobacteriota bacterium]|nr:Uma2 family endonuclease [Acidobacteriota bacterium]